MYLWFIVLCPVIGHASFNIGHKWDMFLLRDATHAWFFEQMDMERTINEKSDSLGWIYSAKEIRKLANQILDSNARKKFSYCPCR